MPEETIPSRSPEEARARIRALSARARLGQWGIAIFVLLSLAALFTASWYNEIPARLRVILGAPPPTKLISIALAVYAFAALIYILARMMEGGGRYRGWSHLGYLAGFYLFYGYAEALRENFWAVFTAGITILGLESYHQWTSCNESIRQEKELLATLERRERFASGLAVPQEPKQ